MSRTSLKELLRASEFFLGALSSDDVVHRGEIAVAELGDGYLERAPEALIVAPCLCFAADRVADEWLAGLDDADVGLELPVLEPAGEELQDAMPDQVGGLSSAEAARGIVGILDAEVHDPSGFIADGPIYDDAVDEAAEDRRQMGVRSRQLRLGFAKPALRFDQPARDVAKLAAKGIAFFVVAVFSVGSEARARLGPGLHPMGTHRWLRCSRGLARAQA